MPTIRGILSILLMLAMGLSAIGQLPQQSFAADKGIGQNLTVNQHYTVSGAETWEVVSVKEGGTLVVPSGATLDVKSILLQGGAFRATGGTVLVTQTDRGADAVIMGDCTEFNVSSNAQLILRAPDGDVTMDESQGGEAIVQVNASISVSVTGGARIQCIGGNGTSTDRPWTTAPLSGYVSAGGRGYISLGGPLTPRVEVSGDAKLITIGLNGGSAADGKPSSDNVGGQGGGFSNGGMVGGFVGSGGDGIVEMNGVNALVIDATIQCTGGRGGDAGNGAAGSPSGGGTYGYSGGGGGGGYGGGNGGSDYQGAGKSGMASGNVGAGGYAEFIINSHDLTIGNSDVNLEGGDGGTPGTGGAGGSYSISPYYAAGGGGGGFGGGGGGSSYAAGGSGSANGTVGAGGEANMSVLCWELMLDGLDLAATGGNSQKGGTGGDGSAGGAGGGGYGGGGGGGGPNAGGNGGATANAGSGGNGTLVAVALNITVTNSSFVFYGGTAGAGGIGGRGGSNGGGGGGGYGGGGGSGNYCSSGGGTGSCSGNVGRGGMGLSRISCGNLWVNSSSFNMTGGRGGDGGTGGSAGNQGGGGGGGYAGGGGGFYYASSDGTVSNLVGDGGDAQIEFYCSHGSIPVSWNQIDTRGGIKGDGKTARGGGTSGGTGKGRPGVAIGAVWKNIPRLIPNATGPADLSLFNNELPTLSWLRQLDGVMFPSTSDSINNYEVQIDNDSAFLTPEEDAKDVDPLESTYEPAHLRGGHFYWRVRALYEGAKSPGWSEVHEFLLNGPPIMLKQIPSVSFAEDGNLEHALDLNAYFSDDLYPGELSYAVAYEQDATKVDAEVDQSWLNLYTRTPDWYGVKKVAIRVTDKGGISMVSNNFTVTVTPVNDPPYFLPLPVVTVTEDESYTFDLGPYVEDVDNAQGQLTIFFSSPYATVEGLNITFYYPREIGSDRLNISLTDGMATVYAWLDVNITAVDDAPVTLPLPALITNEDTNLSMDLTLFASDEEDLPGQLKWRAEDVPTELFGVIIDERNVMRITPVADRSGEGSMLLAVRDSRGNEAMVNLTVKVLSVNDAPVISGVPNLTLAVNTMLKLDVKLYVQDRDNDLSELRVTVNSVYASVSGFVITFEYPNEEGLESDTVRILVSDGKSTGHQDVTVTLKFPPAYTETIGEISVELGKETVVDLTRYVYDREDGATGLKWTVTRVDKSLIEVSVDSTGQMKVKAKDKTGSNDIMLVVTDTDGNKANQTIRIVVTPAGSIFGSGEGMDLLIWALPVVVVLAIIGGAGGMYAIALKRKRRLEEQQGRDEREMIPTGEDRMVTVTAPSGPAGQAAVPADKVCFACGARLVPLGSGSYQCVKCGRTQR